MRGGGRRDVKPRLAAIARPQYPTVAADGESHPHHHHALLHLVTGRVVLVADARGRRLVAVGPEEGVVRVADGPVELEAAVLNHRPPRVGEVRPLSGGVDVVVAELARERHVAVEL